MLEALRELRRGSGGDAVVHASQAQVRHGRLVGAGAGSRFVSSDRKRPACRLRHERRLSPSIQNHQ